MVRAILGFSFLFFLLRLTISPVLSPFFPSSLTPYLTSMAWAETSIDDSDLGESDLPLYEIWLGAISFYIPDYPGSDKSRLRYLALPYGFYRGKIFRADEREGFRSRFLKSLVYELDLSLGASFPVESADNVARKGMPDMDWTGELGPRLKIHFNRDYSKGKWTLSLPLRWVFSTNLKRLDHRGYLFEPRLSYQKKNIFNEDVEFFSSLRAAIATRSLNSYFYQVDPQYEREGRRSYNARAGYLETRLNLGISHKFSREWWTFLSTSWSNFSLSSNSSSPLLKAKNTYSVTLGLAWKFFSSEARAFQE